eukprot:8804072-Pyramimonas_sp.AAC.1
MASLMTALSLGLISDEGDGVPRRLQLAVEARLAAWQWRSCPWKCPSGGSSRCGSVCLRRSRWRPRARVPPPALAHPACGIT